MLKGFKNFKIATKLILSFILVALIAGVVGAVGLV
jgi:CHASE3 domain sensor protein